MYFDKLRTKLNFLDEHDKYNLALDIKEILKSKKINDKVRPVEVLKSLQNFIENKDTSVKYLEVFLQAIDEKYYNDYAILMIKGEKNYISDPSWRDIIIKITSDTPVPKLSKHNNNSAVLLQFKNLFSTLAERCIVDDEGETLENLEALNRIFR
ncbi:hypothetical protein [Bacillus sp. AFS088145]|uniref:hypothetical protein n=1 Tax=Bacillus sp. AFS088145 TaxID=2033514 RepID=UPI000BF39DC4|nr:hypothetical protein [Bacillus sp. AFS088145]PFH91402.1 hypothetical protein COI44_02005 [Bacillus sp. AFS088145]